MKSFLLVFALSFLGSASSFHSVRFSPKFKLQMTGNFDYDVAIIGCGVGGHGAALHARANGLKTAVLTGKVSVIL